MKQRGKLAYIPQVTRTAGTMVQTLARALSTHITNVGQKDYKGYCGKANVAMNTSKDRVRGDTPSDTRIGYWIYPRRSLPLVCTKVSVQDPRICQYIIQKKHQRARVAVNELLESAIHNWADRHKADLELTSIEMDHKCRYISG